MYVVYPVSSSRISLSKYATMERPTGKLYVKYRISNFEPSSLKLKLNPLFKKRKGPLWYKYALK